MRNLEINKSRDRHLHARKDFHRLSFYSKTAAFHVDDRFEQVQVQSSLVKISLTEHPHVRSHEILQDINHQTIKESTWFNVKQWFSDVKSLQNALLWGVYSSHVPLVYWYSVRTANTGRIEKSPSSSPPQSVKSVYSPSSRRYWWPSNPGAE